MLMISCNDWGTRHPSWRRATNPGIEPFSSEVELKSALAKPTVMVSVDSEDQQLRNDIRNYLVKEFREARGMTVVSSDPLFKIYVLAAKMDFPKVPAFAMGVVVTTKSPHCREVTVDHLLLSGNMEDLRKQCQRVVSTFKMGRVARYTGGE
jgi:hypothetical protein